MTHTITDMHQIDRIISQNSEYPTEIFHVQQDRATFDIQEGSYFIFAAADSVIEIDNNVYAMPQSSTSVVGEGHQISLTGDFVIIWNRSQNFPIQINGVVEKDGRLSYINGAKDSLLIHAFKKGVACLNVMFFPPGIVQEKHTHPSLRVGIVVSGKGSCSIEGSPYDLLPGTVIFMEKNTLHHFESITDLVVITYHPDSDFGPTDHDHPMLNRTIVNDGPVLQTKPEVLTKE